MSLKEVKRKQKGCRRRITNDNGHGPFVARICCIVNGHPFKRFCAVQNFIHG